MEHISIRRRLNGCGMEDASSLQVEDDHLTVIGILPHLTKIRFEPEARAQLREWLDRQNKDGTRTVLLTDDERSYLAGLIEENDPQRLGSLTVPLLEKLTGVAAPLPAAPLSSVGARLYSAALAADERFTKELIRVYGKHNAADARYAREHADAGVKQARLAKHKADAAWLGYLRLETYTSIECDGTTYRAFIKSRTRAEEESAPTSVEWLNADGNWCEVDPANPILSHVRALLLCKAAGFGSRGDNHQ